ncbi:MAG: MBL fold metallo-hydrolase [Clostridia bacterium]|nr:MBL fold metallo-hydrolase [Clostridia bacterium]
MEISVRALGPIGANCYMIDKSVMIDPGDDTAGLDEFIKSEHADIGTVVLTHGHFDHILGCAHVKKRCGAKILISRADAPALADAGIALVPEYALSRFEPLEADGFLEAGKISLAGHEFEIIPTPGHTKGGVCLLCREDGVMFTGDTLFADGFGRTDFPGGSVRELADSIMHLFALPNGTYICPGHGQGAYLGDIKARWGKR